MGLVADEVVVADEDLPPPPQVIEGFQLRQHLIGVFVTRLAAVKVDDVAELAIERAPPGSLEAHDDIVVQIQQVITRHRRDGHLRPAGRLDHPMRRTIAPRRQPKGDGSFPLAPHQEIRSRLQDILGHRGGKRAAHHHGFAPRFGLPDEVYHSFPLDDHAGEHDDLGPVPVVGAESPRIEVRQAELPVSRQERRQSNET